MIENSFIDRHSRGIVTNNTKLTIRNTIVEDFTFDGISVSGGEGQPRPFIIGNTKVTGSGYATISASSRHVFPINNQKPEPDVVSDIPEVFVFSSSNFPNPFNPYTTINFVVARHALPVQLHIYNIRGQRVRTLLDGSTEFGAGSHDIVWNGRDDHGRNMSSGVYLYRIQAGDDVAVRRMLLMK